MKSESKSVKYGILLSCILIGLWCLCVYGIRGSIGAWVWNGAVFIIAPLATLLCVLQFFRVVYHCFRKKQLLGSCLLLLVLGILSYPITILFGQSYLVYPTFANTSEGITMAVPVVKENLVIKGGKDFKTHAVWPSECYAYDILAEHYECQSSLLIDYGIYGAPVIAPVSGTVISTKTDEKDIIPNTEDFISDLGNYVMIHIEETDPIVF